MLLVGRVAETRKRVGPMTSFGSRSFRVAAPKIWNSLPLSVYLSVPVPVLTPFVVT